MRKTRAAEARSCGFVKRLERKGRLTVARKLDIEYIRFYTNGSSALKVEPLIPLDEPVRRRRPRVQRKKRIRIYVDPVATLGIVVAGVMLVLMTVGLFQLKSAQQQAAAMEQYVTALQEENAQLSDTYTQGYDLETVERLAKALGMVPKEQAPHIAVELPEEQLATQPSFWERISLFFTELFA